MTGTSWSLERGARPTVDGGVEFRVWAPALERLSVRIDPAGAAREVALDREEGGVFSATVPDVAVGADYVYRLPGGDRPDPVSRHQPAGVHGPSRVVDPGAFRWTDIAWRGRAMADLVLYELHVGTFTAAATFAGVGEHLGRLRELGVTAIELMPVAAFPGARNWGYDGVALYAPHAAYGGPQGLRRLVDLAHAADLAVVLDVVYNHLGPEGNYLGEFGPYFTDRYRTPWGGALNFDDADSDEVRRFVVDNACYWVDEFHVDGLRLDAVHAIFDFSARHILDEIADAVHALGARRGRETLVIAESDLNDPRLVRDHARGGYALDGQWSDDFHHAVHAALTAEHFGYYADFGGADALATALTRRFVYDGKVSRYRRRRHGAPAADVPAERFVVFVQNHDQVGNRAGGERLTTLVPPPAQRLATALLLLAPYVPLLFMGEEYGETNPFLYFVSHGDPALVEAVRAGRRREFAAFAWQGEVPDPQAEETFARSRLDHARARRPEHAARVALHRDLLRLRATEPLLRPGAATVEAVAEGSVVRLVLAGERRLQAVFNLAEGPAEVALTGAEPTTFALRLATEDARYGGAGTMPPARVTGATRVTLAAWAAALYVEEAA